MKGPDKERRRFPRHVGTLPIEIRDLSHSYPMQCETTGISIGGCYVKTMYTLPVGTTVNLRIWVADQVFNIKGTVRTADQGLGNGIEFGEMSAQQRNQFARYLDNLCGSNADPTRIIR